jgi:glycosyltransferase involved in cell wall biosynthesis
MKIALLHYAAPPVVGGLETVLARQAQQLARAGHQVRILAGRGETQDALMPVEVYPRFDSRYPHVLKVKAELDRGEVTPDFFSLVERIFADLQRALASTDFVIVHNVASLNKNLALTAALHRLSQSSPAPRLILWHHDLAWTTPDYADELHPGYPWDLLRLPWAGARQVVVSQARRDELAALMDIPAETIAVVPAGVDLQDFLALSTRMMDLAGRLALLDARPLLLAPVRVTRRKNLELGLRILAALRQEMPQAGLVVTGPPGAHNPANADYLRELQALRGKLKLEGAAHLLAEHYPDGLADAQIAELYRLSDVLLMTSREEGFGIPIIEAGLGRLPIFCTDLPPLRALAGEWATYFSPDADPRAVARQIARRLEDDPAYCLRARVKAENTWQSIYTRQIAPLLEAK